MRRRQQTNESVDEVAQDFKRLFEQSYGRRQGMDESSCAMLKRENVFSRSTDKVVREGSAFSRDLC